MDAGGIDQISKLLQRMREERNQGKESVLSKDRPPIGRQKYAPDLMDEEDEEGDIMPSRYVRDPAPQLEEAEYEESSEDLSAQSQDDDPPPEKPQPRGFQARAASAKRLSPDPSSSDESVEDPRQKLSKRMDELRARRQMLGPPARVQPEVEETEKTEELEEEPVVERPRTALPRTTVIKSLGHKGTGPSFIMTPAKKLKKTDPVSLYQQRQKEWQKNKFLKANKENAKEGRKLKLAENARKPNFMVVHEKPQVPPKVQYIAPHEKRRDDLRFQTRTAKS